MDCHDGPGSNSGMSEISRYWWPLYHPVGGQEIHRVEKSQAPDVPNIPIIYYPSPQ